MCNQAPTLGSSFSATGTIVQWVVPATGPYSIVARGAQGCASSGLLGGRGASMQGIFSLTAGETLSILVGQQPCATTTLYPGGGGGSFVALGANYATATPLVVAGGGGGVYSGTAPAACGGQTTQLGSGNVLYQPSAGYGSLAAPCCGGGGGFYSSGGTDTLYSFPGAQGFRQGGAGAVPNPTYGSSYTSGGFGGGGTANYVGSCNTQGGPGGGYSGGTGNDGTGIAFGNGGGSFNGGSSQINTASSNSGAGSVQIFAATFAPTASPTSSVPSSVALCAC